MGSIDSATRFDLLEIIDVRAGTRATIITSLLPIAHWHAWIGDASIADALLDRIMQRNYRFTLSGDSLSQPATKTLEKEMNVDPSRPPPLQAERVTPFNAQSVTIAESSVTFAGIRTGLTA